MLHFIVATRCQSSEEFVSKTLTGRSLKRLQHRFPLRIGVEFNSSSGLPAAYNVGIEAAAAEDILVFLHDDVQIDDWHLAVRLEDGLRRFGVLGAVGNALRVPHQATWYGQVVDLPDGKHRVDKVGTPLGGFAHADGALDVWSSEPAACKLVDGFFLATRRSRLDIYGIRFDPRFRYHFYDMDFCRQCEQAGLSVGVWPLALTHGSGGRFDRHWVEARQAYFDKWGS